jgi:ribonuclease HII
VPFDPALAADYPVVTGCDEVGRGALCGPVVAAAVWFDPAAIPSWLLEELDDSKQLTRKMRARLAVEIRRVARVSIASSSAAMIDRRGIRPMTLDAMRRAVLRLKIDGPVRIDGLDIPSGIASPCLAIVKGDATVPQIAAASIVAKVARDRLMIRLARRYPGYGWEKNVGYGTAEHLAALEKLGPCAEHRMSYAPISQRGLVFDDEALEIEAETTLP